MKRREFIGLLGGAAAAWPLAARGQQGVMPTIGYLGFASPDTFVERLRAFRQGLGEAGYVEGRNVRVEYRWAEGRADRLPSLATELVRAQVAVLATLGSGAAALAAKAATATIPIVFETGIDPVAFGLVDSLNKPGHNVTGAMSLNTEVAPKRLEVLHQLSPSVGVVAILVSRGNPTGETQMKDTAAAAASLGLKVEPIYADSEGQIDAAFERLAAMGAVALVITADPFFDSRSERLATLALNYKIPAIAQPRDFPMAGGLASYGGNYTESHHQAGIYVGRILKGERPADLPVQQDTKIELAINMKTAKALGLTVPLPLLGRADEVIE